MRAVAAPSRVVSVHGARCRHAARASRFCARARRVDTSDEEDSAKFELTRRAQLGALLLSHICARPGPALAEATTECFFDIAVEGEPLGRVLIEVDESTLAGKRFVQLCRGVGGLSYRRTVLDSIEVSESDESEIYLKNSGVAGFVTPGTQTPVDIVGGPSAERLVSELETQTTKHDDGGLVSIIVRRNPDDPEPEPKARLVSVRGKFETVYDPPPPPPNGTSFVITLQAAPELDATNVIVGKVVGGFDVLKEISQLPTVKDNTNSPFFAVAKSIGDKRALVAEQAFRKPFKKVQFMKVGVTEAPTSSE